MKKNILAAAVLAIFATGLYAAEKKVAAKSVAVVNGQKVTADELTKKLWWQYAAQGLSELVDEKLLLEEGGRLGATADQKELETRYNNLAAGYADKAAFENNLKSVGWTSADLRELIRRQLIIRGTVIAAKKLAVTDADTAAFFEKNKERLGTPESVKLSQIFVNTKAEADDAHLALSAGADFAKLSSLKSTDANLKKNNGSLGYISKGMLLPEIEKEIFALQDGQYTKPLATGNGFSIFRTEEHKPGKEASFEVIKAELKTAILNQAITAKLPELATELRQKAKIEIIK
ncbi:MAG: peptidyl-prolyl cis-trans isomerase [Elusimicrobiota bacterium]|nr:peptidyl-prolyl cis-trans isomerase [Elusimicrobiota bacterium]